MVSSASEGVDFVATSLGLVTLVSEPTVFYSWGRDYLFKTGLASDFGFLGLVDWRRRFA